MSEPEPEATPEQQAAVRRLLGQARHTEPVPPDVAARLDGVLAQLVAAGPGSVDPARPAGPAAVPAPDQLAARRRRRVTGLLVAAAAVVVVGVGVGQVVGTTGGDDSGDTSAAESVQDTTSDDRATFEAEGGADGFAPGPSAPSAAPEAPSEESEESGESARTPRITEASFARAVERLNNSPGVPSREGQVIDGDLLSRGAMFVCPPAEWGPGRLVGVLYDAIPAVLAYRPATGRTQAVDLLQCGSGDVVRSTVLRR